jgi:hypothetical protein
MGFQDFISEHEATSITGMSKTTLSRFAEAGYLQLETDADGLRMFSKGELAALFGLKEPSQRSKAVERTVEAKKPAQSKPAQEAKPIVEIDPEPVFEYAAEVVDAPPAQPAPLTETAATKAAPANSDTAMMELEIQRLKNLMQLQEKILDMKEQQIRDLKEQRDWLQSRVEKLEDKADRDQILLLTETQTIRTLVNLNQQRRRSPMRLALEWLGVSAPAEEAKNSPEAIDVMTGRSDTMGRAA